MRKYRDLLHAIRAVFPQAKEVSVTILTTDDEKILFASELTRFGEREGLMVIPAAPIDLSKDMNVQFDILGKISVSNYDKIDSVDAVLRKTSEDKEGDRGYTEPRY